LQLILVRHGLPVREENPDGQPADPPLSSEGQEQAERVAAWLGRERIDALYTSPMRRARETAAPLEAKLGVAANVEAGVMELDHLSTSYEPLEQLKARDPGEWRRMVDGGLYENVDLGLFRQNVVTALTGIVERHSGESVAVFCHGGVINAWSGAVLGVSEPFFFFEPGYTAIHRYLVARTGERNLLSLNETGHLRASRLGR
jgi:probable phosphoglycerate mutase